MFFTYLNQVLSPGVDLHLTVSKTSAGMVVALLPKINGLKDPAQNKIVPLRLTAAPQDLDAQFFPTITAPIQKTSGLLINLKQFEEQADQAAKNSKAVKSAKEAESKDAREKKEKYDSFAKKAEEQEAAGNLDGAITNLQQARLHATEKQVKTVDERIAALRSRMSQQSLFEVEPVQPQAVQQPALQQAEPPVQQPQAMQSVQQPVPPTPQQQAPAGQDMAPPVQAPRQAAQPDMQPNVQGFGMFGQQPVQAAAPQAQQAQPVQQAQQASQPQPAYTQHYPTNGVPMTEPVHMSGDAVVNPADYAGITDFQYTHVGEMMSDNQKRF